MHDFDYDVKEKKSIARGAFAKKGGSRSKKCTLPDDSLTPAQRAKLSKTLVSVNLKAPMTAAQFKLLPTNIKREYLTFLHDEIGATSADISSDLFGMNRGYLLIYLRRYEPSLLDIFQGGRGVKMTQDAVKKWREFLGKPDAEPEEQAAPEQEPEQEVFKETHRPATCLAAALTPKSLSASYEGELYEADLNDIIHLLVGGRCVKGFTINITF